MTVARVPPSVTQVREEIVERLDDLSEEVLRAVHTLINASIEQQNIDHEDDDFVVGYEPDGAPITKVDIKKIAAEAKEDYENGRYTTLDDIKKETDQWLESIK